MQVNGKWKPGWKVARNCGGRLISANIKSSMGAVEYSQKQITIPHKNNGPLAIFNNKGPAELFIAQARRFKIYNVSIHQCAYSASNNFGLWVKGFNQLLHDAPPGTILADAVMLLPEEDEHA